MHLPFTFRTKNLKKLATASPSDTNDTQPSGAGIQELKIEDYPAVSGGPQVKNEPQVLGTEY